MLWRWRGRRRVKTAFGGTATALLLSRRSSLSSGRDVRELVHDRCMARARVEVVKWSKFTHRE
jgi:hypothetical protein